MKFKIYRVVKENDSFLNVGLEVQYVTRSDGMWKNYYLNGKFQRCFGPLKPKSLNK